MSVRTELILARHGEAECNVAGLVGGERTCTGLTELGRNQVRRLAHRLRDEEPIHVLYTSPRRRTRDTAALLGATLGLEPRIDQALRGLEHGDADGQDWATLKSNFQGRPQWRPDLSIAAGAEPWNAYLSRTRAALARIVAEHDGQRILVAAHGECIEASFSHFLDLPLTPHEQTGFVTGHVCLTRWQRHVNRFGHGVWMLASHNDTRHLCSTPEKAQAT